jgi:hypothetical protein
LGGLRGGEAAFLRVPPPPPAPEGDDERAETPTG